MRTKLSYTDFCNWLIFLQIMVYKNWKLILLKWLSKIDYRIVFLCLYVRKQFHDRLLHHSRKKAYILFSMTWYKIMLSIWYPVIRIIDCNSTEHHESIIFSVFIISKLNVESLLIFPDLNTAFVFDHILHFAEL